MPIALEGRQSGPSPHRKRERQAAERKIACDSTGRGGKLAAMTKAEPEVALGVAKPAVQACVAFGGVIGAREARR